MTASLFRRCSMLAAGLCCLTLASCNSTKKSGDYSGVVDYTTPNTNLSQEEYPFDEKGNYLADVVSGKKKGSKNKKTGRPVAYTDTYEKPPETTVANNINYETPPAPTVAADPYSPVYASGTGSGSTTTQPKTSSSSGSSSGSSKSKSSFSGSSKSRPKTTAKSKPKPKPQPGSVSYTIKKGDTLYGLASRYGTSVAAIKKASGLSSDMLRDGRTIKIPRK